MGWDTKCSAQARDLRGPCHQDLPWRADRTASDPTSRDVQLLRTTKQNKGVRRGRSQYAFQSPRAPKLAPSRASSPGPPAGGGPRPGWAAPWSLVSLRLPVTGAGEAAQGQPKRWENQMVPNLLPPPPLPPTYPPIHPSHSSPSGPAAWPLSAGTWPGSPRGKDCLCLKVTTRSAVPGLGLVPSIPRPTELELRGHPKSREVTGVEAPLFPSFDPQKQGPCRTRQLRGRGSPTLPVGSRGTKSTPHCLGAMERGRPSGQHPSSSLPTSLQRTPGSPRHPQEGLGEGGAQDARQEGEKMDLAVYGPRLSPEKAGSTRRGGGPEGG